MSRSNVRCSVPYFSYHSVRIISTSSTLLFTLLYPTLLYSFLPYSSLPTLYCPYPLLSLTLLYTAILFSTLLYCSVLYSTLPYSTHFHKLTVSVIHFTAGHILPTSSCFSFQSLISTPHTRLSLPLPHTCGGIHVSSCHLSNRSEERRVGKECW